MTEANVALTDYLLTLISVACAAYFIKNNTKKIDCFLWIGYFLFISIGSFLGGTSHGFWPQSTVLWLSTLLSLGISISFGWCLLGYYLHWPRWVIASCFIFVLSIYTILIIINPVFIVSNAFYGILLISFITLSLIRFLQTRNESWLFLCGGWLLSLIAGLVQYLHIDLNQVWDYNTLCHIIGACSFVLIFLGAKKLVALIICQAPEKFGKSTRL